MKKATKLLSLVLSLLLAVTAFAVVPAYAEPSGTAVVFVKDGGDGSGASADSPLGSVSTAATTIARAGGGTIVVCGEATVSGNTAFGTRAGTTIKVTSVYDGVDYREKGAKFILGKAWTNFESREAFEFDDIEIAVMGNNCSFYADGYPITFGRGVTTSLIDQDEKKAANWPNVYGGSACDLSGTDNWPANTSVTVLGGTYNLVVTCGKGDSRGDRPSKDGSLSIGENVTIMGKGTFCDNPVNAAVEGKKILVVNGGTADKADVAEADITITATGNGYVQSLREGVVNLCADSGYAAKIDGEFVVNGEYSYEGASLKVSFEKSDINKAAELAKSRPQMPAAFPGEYIKGYSEPDGTHTFRPENDITIAEATTILVRLMTTEEKVAGKYQTDKANPGDWFYDNVASLDAFGFFDAFDNFDGDRAITRAEFVQLIVLSKKLQKNTDEVEFTDVAADYKYADAIKESTEAGLIKGYKNDDGSHSFKPENSITRAEVVTIINRVFGMADLAPIKYKNMIPAFTDVDPLHWAAYQIIAAAGGKEKPKEEVKLEGTGNVEFAVEGPVVFADDSMPAENDGLTPKTALPYDKAKNLLGDKGGTIVLSGQAHLASNYFLGGIHTGTVLVTSVYDGVDYRSENDAAFIYEASWKNLSCGGDVILDNVAIISKGANCSIYADNHHLTVGKDVVCVLEEGGAYPTIYGGSACDLSATRNYIGSEDTTVSHTGDYNGHVTVNGGTWTGVYGGGKGTTEKPRESNCAVVEIGPDAKVGSVDGRALNEQALVHGLKTIILNNTDAYPVDDSYDVIVSVSGDGCAEAIAQDKESVTIKVTAADGKPVEGLENDTYTFKGEGSMAVTLDAAGNKAVIAGKGDIAVDDGNVTYITDAELAAIDAKAEALKNEILNTKTTVKPANGGKAYYVSTSGDDANDGLSEAKPIKSIDKVNTLSLGAGDVVYFKRGDMWRTLTTLSAKSGVTYSAYGEGAKPIISRSPFDGAKTGTWTLTDIPNVYKYSENMTNDIGSISFNNETYTEKYAQRVHFGYTSDNKAYLGGAVVDNPLTKLTNDLDYWHDLGGPVLTASKGTLYLRSDSGNPAERFSNIEFNPNGHTIRIGGNNVTIDNLDIRHAGSHGISAGTVANLKVTNCVILWIGGTAQNYTAKDGIKWPTRFGNSVEVYGGCDGYLIDHCYIDQAYDAGVTHQYSDSSAGDCIMKNVTYSNNLILNCVYSIEYFNRKNAGTTRYLSNIKINNNICRYAGYGFGITRPDGGMIGHFRSGTIVPDTADFVVENNIFDRSTGNMFYLAAGGDEEIQWKNNTYIQYYGDLYGTIKGAKTMYNGVIAESVKAGFKYPEVGGTYYFMKK